MVLTARPPLLLLDEPTRGLDYAAKARLVTVLRGLAAEGHAIVLATHDVELAAELAHRVVDPRGRRGRRRRADRRGRRRLPVLRPAGREDPGAAAVAHRRPGRARPSHEHPRTVTAPAPRAPPPVPRAGPAQPQARAVRLGPRSVAALALVSAVGVGAFGWPLLAGPASQVSAHAQDAPWLFAGLLVLLVAVVAATISESGLGPKAVAMLGVLAATGAALRPIGAGTAGIEPMFFLMVLSGRVLGPGLRLRARVGDDVRLGAAHRRGGAVDAVPDAGHGVVHDGRRAAAGPRPAARPGASCCCSPGTGSSPPSRTARS